MVALNKGVLLSVWQRFNKSAWEGAVRKYGLIICFIALVAWPSMTRHAFGLGLAFVIMGKRTLKQRVGLLLLLAGGVTWAGMYYHFIPKIGRAHV